MLFRHRHDNQSFDVSVSCPIAADVPLLEATAVVVALQPLVLAPEVVLARLCYHDELATWRAVISDA